MNDLSSTALKLEGGRLRVLDQTALPQQELWLETPDVPSMIRVIRELKVRGAPLIGVAAALQLGLLAEKLAAGGENKGSVEPFEKYALALREARPTAVNLMHAVDRLLQVARTEGLMAVPRVAEEIFREDVELCARMSAFGGDLIRRGERVLTHCNTGGLATVGAGTAFGCLLWAHQNGRAPHVWVDETRPLLQGARLTTWELARAGIAHTLICDNMAGFLMQRGEVSRVMVGADRIAKNGDFANKVGTYSLAVLAKHHGVPFHVVAPRTTVDEKCATGRDIPIEERASSEVRRDWSPAEVGAWNPAFDVTPAELVTSWVLDRGVFTKGSDVCGR